MDRYVLSAHVRMTPRDSIPASFERGLREVAGQFVLALEGSRQTAKLIDTELVDLLSEFASPREIGAAIVAHCKRLGSHPSAQLEQCLSAVQEMIKCGFLVREGQDEQNGDRLVTGRQVRGFVVQNVIQELDDATVAIVADDRGDKFVMKRGGAAGSARRLRNEADILMRLQGNAHPYLVAAWEDIGNQFYCVQEYVEGAPIDRVTLTMAMAGKLKLAHSVAKTIADLHSQGVIHGDIHPGNILVTVDGVPRLIDFGLSRLISAVDGLDGERGAVAYYMDPQLAAAKLGRTHYPAPTTHSDQYSLAATLYFCIHRAHYIDFVLERWSMLRQICEEKPRSPGGAAAGPLLKALSKLPEDRYRDISLFAQDLNLEKGTSRPITRKGKVSSRRLAEREFLIRLGKEVENGGRAWNVASINSGAAGVGLGLQQIARQRFSAELLDCAVLWTSRAARLIEQGTGLFDFQGAPTRTMVPRYSVWYGEAGPLIANATVCASAGNIYEARRMVRQIREIEIPESAVCEMEFGIAGLLLGIAHIANNSPPDFESDLGDLLTWGDRLSDQLDLEIGKQVLAGSFPDGTVIGLAHGWAGIVYSRLRWSQQRGAVPPEAVVRMLEMVAAHSRVSGAARRWKRKVGRPDELTSWCNGSAGQTLLWALASEVTGLEKYKSLCLESATDAAIHPDKSLDLCCGDLGRALGFTSAFALSGETKWLRLAQDIVEKIADLDRIGSVLHDASLFKGWTGLYVTSSAVSIGEPCIPFFGLASSVAA